MKTRLLLIPVFFVWYCCCAVSQDINSALKLETKRNADESVNILAKTYSPGTFGIVMEFTGLTNTSHPRWSYASVRGSGTVATLRPLSSEQGVGYSYVYTYNRGRANPRHSASVTYRLPFSAGKTCLCNTLSYLWEDIRDRPEEWHPWMFHMEKGDTVFAMRKGRVVDIHDGEDPVSDSAVVSYSSHSNKMIIEHEDGTLAYYNVLEKNSFMVKVGDIVYPDTPLALAGSFDKIYYQVRVNVRMLRVDFGKMSDSGDLSDALYYSDINPVFMTEKGPAALIPKESYKSVVTVDIVEAEMTKKEIKKRAGR